MTTISVKVNVPENLASKRLKIKTNSDGTKRKIVISSNFLPVFGFEKGAKVLEKSLGKGKGFLIKLVDDVCDKGGRTKSVYGRTYKRKKNNAFETLTETSSQRLLDETIPKDCENIHVTFKHGLLIVKPLIETVVQRIKRVIDAANPLSVFAACTSGVDAHMSEKAGFVIDSALDWRPNEMRDKTDKTETGLMAAIANCRIKNIFNEDIYEVSPEYLEWATKNSQSCVMTVSLQCDDFSNAKNSKDKEKSFNDGTSTLDMAFSALNIIKKLQFPMVLLENVPNFGNSDIYRMWDLQLRRMGYQTYSAVLDARDHGGYTCRKRFFHFATSLPLKFEWPCAEKRNEECLYEKFVSSRLEDFRDVSHTKSAQLSEGSGRSNYLSKGSTYTKTIMKSSARQQKDALYIHEEGSDKYLWPDVKLIQDLMTVPDSYNLDIVTDEVAKEILGQGVDGGLFESIMVKIKEHIKSFLEGDQRLAYC